MSRNPKIRNAVAVSLIFLFVGISIIPVMGGLVLEEGMSDIQLCKNRLQQDNDTTPPVTTATTDPEPTSTGWYLVPVLITLNATDDESGVNSTYYQVNAGGWMTYTHPFWIEEIGTVLVQFYSVDNAGNVEDVKQLELKIDHTPPTTSCFLDPPVPNGLNGWYVSDVTVTLNATDNESGVEKTYCCGENYTKPVLIAREGLIEVDYESIDNVGNLEPTQYVQLRIDKTKPTILLDYTWEKIGVKYIIIVTATCNDALSEMAKVEFYFNNVWQETVTGAGPDYVWTYEYTPNLTKCIKAIAYDNAGWSNSADIYSIHNTQNHLIQYFLHHWYALHGLLLR